VRSILSGAVTWLLLGGVFPGLAYGAPGPAQRLVDECRLQTTYCEAYLSAVIETAQLSGQYVLMVSGSHWICMPEDLSYDRARKLLLAYHEARPKDVVYTPGAYVLNVLETSFPCAR